MKLIHPPQMFKFYVQNYDHDIITYIYNIDIIIYDIPLIELFPVLSLFFRKSCGEGPVGGQAAEVAELRSAAPRTHRGDPTAPHRRHHRGQARGRRAGREGEPCFQLNRYSRVKLI